MNASLKGKLVAGFILAFLAGGATGTFFTFHQARNWRTDWTRHSHSVAERMRDRIKSQLDLTPDQVAKIEPILDHTLNELQQIRAETGARVRQVMGETNQAMKPILTEAQWTKLEQIEAGARAKRGPRNPARRRSPRDAKPDENNSHD
jgi:Spy/CpxP family protein refolding chaperone